MYRVYPKYVRELDRNKKKLEMNVNTPFLYRQLSWRAEACRYLYRIIKACFIENIHHVRWGGRKNQNQWRPSISEKALYASMCRGKSISSIQQIPTGTWKKFISNDLEMKLPASSNHDPEINTFSYNRYLKWSIELNKNLETQLVAMKFIPTELRNP